MGGRFVFFLLLCSELGWAHGAQLPPSVRTTNNNLVLQLQQNQSASVQYVDGSGDPLGAPHLIATATDVEAAVSSSTQALLVSFSTALATQLSTASAQLSTQLFTSTNRLSAELSTTNMLLASQAITASAQLSLQISTSTYQLGNMNMQLSSANLELSSQTVTATNQLAAQLSATNAIVSSQAAASNTLLSRTNAQLSTTTAQLASQAVSFSSQLSSTNAQLSSITFNHSSEIAVSKAQLSTAVMDLSAANVRQDQQQSSMVAAAQVQASSATASGLAQQSSAFASSILSLAVQQNASLLFVQGQQSAALAASLSALAMQQNASVLSVQSSMASGLAATSTSLQQLSVAVGVVQGQGSSSVASLLAQVALLNATDASAAMQASSLLSADVQLSSAVQGLQAQLVAVNRTANSQPSLSTAIVAVQASTSALATSVSALNTSVISSVTMVTSTAILSNASLTCQRQGLLSLNAAAGTCQAAVRNVCPTTPTVPSGGVATCGSIIEGATCVAACGAGTVSIGASIAHYSCTMNPTTSVLSWVLVSPAISCPVPTITIVTGVYGAGCSSTANAMPSLGTACNGRASCSYLITVGVLGDPAGGCPKPFDYSWTCCSGGTVRANRIGAEANGNTLTITCNSC